MAINEGFLRIQETSKNETTTTNIKGFQPLLRVKDKDKDSDSSYFLNISLFESQIKQELITQYGKPDVDYAVREAIKHNKNNLAYIDGICKKRIEKEAIKKSLEVSRQKKMEQYKNLTPEQRKSWSNLHLYELACSITPADPPQKEINSG
jgi:DNA gyrase/topoisomerase IV subunit B